MTRDNPAYTAVQEHEDDAQSGHAKETTAPPSVPLVDPDWYEEPLVEDSFGQPIFSDLMSTSSIFYAGIPPIDPPANWSGVWAGIGCMSDVGLPFDFLEMGIGLAILARKLRCKASLLIADAHALTTDNDKAKICARAERIARHVRRIFANLGFCCDVFFASTLLDDPVHKEFVALAGAWERNGEPGLPPYLRLGMADSAFMALNCRLKVGWSMSANPTIDKGGYHEPATDLRARHLQCRFGGIYTRPGFTLRREWPNTVPYTELRDPEARLMLTGRLSNFDYSGQIAKANRSAKSLRNLEHRVGLITGAFEQEFGELGGDTTFQKAESLARIATVGL